MYVCVQVPALPGQFTTELSDIVKSMLSRNATCRPSVHQLLRMEYIRTHIKLFLDRASNKKRWFVCMVCVVLHRLHVLQEDIETKGAAVTSPSPCDSERVS